eukprot:7390967-Prymnesium_polylepis.1
METFGCTQTSKLPHMETRGVGSHVNENRPVWSTHATTHGSASTSLDTDADLTQTRTGRHATWAAHGTRRLPVSPLIDTYLVRSHGTA